MKPHYSLIATLLIVAMVLTNLGIGTSHADVGTTVGGIINSSTTWTAANSPYTLTSDIQIAADTTLTIEPGVVINGQGNSIKVWGNLNAVGNNAFRVIFNNVSIRPGISENRSKQFLINIQFSDINGGSLYEPSGYANYGSLTLKDSKISNLNSYIYPWYPQGNSYIERNIFLNSGGISVGDGPGSVYIKNNVFYKQTTSYAVQNWNSSPLSETIVGCNSFLSTDRIALKLPPGYSGASMIAQDNYWNTTDTSTVESMTYDRSDDLACSSYIEYEPILASPHPETPVINSSVEVISTDPVNNASNVPINSPVTITYRNPIFAGNAYNSISIKDADDHELSITKNIANNILTLTTTNMTYETTYTVTIPQDAIKDAEGISPLQANTFSFKTQLLLDPKELVYNCCTECHTAHRWESKFSSNLTEMQWARIVDQMVRYGAQLTPEQSELIVEYLTWMSKPPEAVVPVIWNDIVQDEDAQTSGVQTTIRGIAPPGLTSLTDIDLHWARYYIMACVRGEIINGYPGNKFKPDKTATRAEASKMIVNLLDNK